MSKPSISVLMGVYYRRDDLLLLQRSVDSILAQSYSDFELLICDDGSNAAAKELLDSYAAEDERVQLVRPGAAYRLPVKLNFCLKESKGSYIARMDDDDFSRPERFERQIQALEDYTEIAFVGCNVALCRACEIFGERLLPAFPYINDFYITQPFIHPTLMFRKSALERVNGYSEEPYCDKCEDYDLLLRMYKEGCFGMNLQEILFDYTAPSVRGNRTMKHRWNEAVTRWRRFSDIGVLHKAFPYVVKPLGVGIIPSIILPRIKN